METVKHPPSPMSPNKSGNSSNGKLNKCCTSPEEVITIALALTVLFAQNLNKTELETLVNILGILATNLSGIVTQIDICSGVDVNENITVI